MLAAGQTDETVGVFSKFVLHHRTSAFWRAQFHTRQEPAKILVTFPGFGEQRIANACCRSDFGANMCLYAGFLRSEMKPWRAVNAVAI